MGVGRVCASAATWEGGLVGWYAGAPLDDFVEIIQSKGPS